MQDPGEILNELRAEGHRITRARRAIVEIFSGSTRPLSASEIHDLLDGRNIRVNITTIYREIEFLKGRNIIRELNLGDGRRRYERWPDNHHHHLVCVSCDSIECVELQGCLETEEEILLTKNGFRTIRHTLEFHGICDRCSR